MTRTEACMKLAQDEYREADRSGRHGPKMRAKAFVFAASGKRLSPGLEARIEALMQDERPRTRRSEMAPPEIRRAEYLREVGRSEVV